MFNMILAYYSLLSKDDLMLIRAVILAKGIQPKNLDPVKRSYHVEMEICLIFYRLLLSFNSKTRITFYGGIHVIGGNKFLIEDRGTRIFLDFGMQMSKFNQYFAGFVNPRTCNGMNDLFEFGLL